MTLTALLLAAAVSGPAHGAAAGERMRSVSDPLVGTPYVLGPLGEGPEAEFDRDPLFSTAAFDCTTFVETSMALALSSAPPRTLEILRRIRYKDGIVGFATRNHFPETDWLPNNIAAGFLEDVTAKAAPESFRTVKKRISKREWYLSLSTADLKGFDGESEEARAARARRLQALGAAMPDEEASVAYIPLEALARALPRIPSGAVGSLVRESRPDKPVVITHQLLLFEGPKGKFVRHAAFGKSVQDVPALEYFARFKDAPWKVIGLNVAVVREAR